MTDMNKVYEVYFCYYKDELVYIGSGIKGRGSHCISGISHVYELNELWFTGNRCDVRVDVVKYFGSKTDSLDYEKTEIKRLQPKYNKVFLKTNRQELSQKSLLKKSKLREILIRQVRSKKDKISIKSLLNEFLSFYHINQLKGEVSIYSVDTYKNKGFVYLPTLVRCMRYPNLYSNKHYCKKFLAVVEQEFDCDFVLVKRQKH